MPDALKLLTTRRSFKAVELAGPALAAAEIDTLLTIASRVPDHGKLVPWRFIVFEGEARRSAGAAYHGNHEWRAHETLALGLDMFRPRVRVVGTKCSGDCLAGRPPRLAFEHDEAPRCQLAVIGDP